MDFVKYITTARPKSHNIPMGHFAGEPAKALVAYTNDDGTLDLYVYPTEEHVTWVSERTGETILKPIFVPRVEASKMTGAVGFQHQQGTWVPD